MALLKTKLSFGQCKNKLLNGFWENEASYWLFLGLCKTWLPIGLIKTKCPILQSKTKLTIGSCKSIFPIVMYKTRLPVWPCKTRHLIGQFKTKLQVGFLQIEVALCFSFQINLFLCPLYNTHNCGAVLRWLAETVHKTPFFFSSLCREALNENMTAEQLHLM